MTSRLVPKDGIKRTRVSTYLTASLYVKFKRWCLEERRSVKDALEILIEEKVGKNDAEGQERESTAPNPTYQGGDVGYVFDPDQEFEDWIREGESERVARERVEDSCERHGVKWAQIPAVQPEWLAAGRLALGIGIDQVAKPAVGVPGVIAVPQIKNGPVRLTVEEADAKYLEYRRKGYDDGKSRRTIGWLPEGWEAPAYEGDAESPNAESPNGAAH